jgi:vancomycin permeability regulator SanA
MVRGALILLGLLLGVATAGELVRPGFDALGWVVDVEPLGRVPGLLVRGLAAWALSRLAFSAWPTWTVWRTGLWALVVLLATQVGALAQASVCGGAMAARGMVVAGLALLLVRLHRRVPAWGKRRSVPATALQVLALGTALALVHIASFSPAPLHPHPPADRAAAVVFGSRAYADGTASPVLAARMAAACRLHAEGKVSWLILSGGPADGRMHETEAMRRLARACGVGESAVLIDRDGWSSHLTVVASLELARQHRLTRLVPVSQGWHLARITLDYRRRGVSVAGAAAAEPRTLAPVVRQHLREVIAFWGYFLLRP